MKTKKVMGTSAMTFHDGCEAYLLNCRQRNLREATIKHYQQSYTQFYKQIAPDMPLKDFDVKVYEGYVRFLLDKLDNDVSVNSYLRDLITTLHFLMDEGHIRRFKMKSIRVDKQAVDTYTDEELQTLLRKPDTKTCRYVEYQCWVMTNLLFSTGIRQRSMMNLTIRDVDLDNRIVGLSQMDEQGMSAIATLEEIGISEIRLRDTLLRATNATELFAETQIMANAAWEDNSALVEEAGKRYQTTASKLTNLKNKAVLFGQQIGDDLNPTIQNLIEGADDLLDSFLEMDEAQRLQIIKWAGIAAATGPVLLGISKV